MLIQCSPVSCLSSPGQLRSEARGWGKHPRGPWGNRAREEGSLQAPLSRGGDRTNASHSPPLLVTDFSPLTGLHNNLEQLSPHCTDEKTKACRAATCSRVIPPRNLGLEWELRSLWSQERDMIAIPPNQTCLQGD